MMLDTNLLLLNAGNVFAAAGTATTTNVIDLGSPVKNVGAGEDLFMIVTVTTSFVGAGAFVDFRAVTDAQDPIATDNTGTIVGATGPTPITLLTAGTRFIIPLRKFGPTPVYERYLGLNVVTTIATTTAGAVTVEFMSQTPDGWVAHVDAVQ